MTGAEIKETAIYKAAVKIFPETYDMVHYMQLLFSLPENHWSLPTNKEEGIYDVCIELASVHLIAQKYVPVWDNGSFKGRRLYIMYNRDLRVHLHA